MFKARQKPNDFDTGKAFHYPLLAHYGFPVSPFENDLYSNRTDGLFENG